MTGSIPLILASTSRYRSAQLERLGIPFRAVSPDVDEDELKTRIVAPHQLAQALARAKAERVRAAHPDAAVIGGDQLVSLDGRILGKPGSVEAAVDQLERMAGREHELVTALAVAHPGGLEQHLDVTRLSMRPLARDALERYVLADRPLDCAGSYKLEERGIALFDRIDSADQSAITGLPLIALTTILRRLGCAIP